MNSTFTRELNKISTELEQISRELIELVDKDPIAISNNLEQISRKLLLVVDSQNELTQGERATTTTNFKTCLHRESERATTTTTTNFKTCRNTRVDLRNVEFQRNVDHLRNVNQRNVNQRNVNQRNVIN